jgi:hypothetical protein
VKPKCSRYSIEELSGDRSGGLRQALGDHLALSIGITTAAEDDLNGRQSLARGRANGCDVLRTGEQTLERPRHQRFDLGGIQSRRLGLHQHVRRGEVRKHVELRVQERVDAEQRNQQRERRDNLRVCDRATNAGGKHGLSRALLLRPRRC